MLWLKNPSPDNALHTIQPNALDEESIKILEEYVSKNELVAAETMQSDPETIKPDDVAVRKTNIMWVENNDETSGLYWNIANLIQGANNGKFKCDISMIETLQYSEYEDGGHYQMHVDHGMISPDDTAIRKLSFSILLSDEKDFDGGELDITSWHPQGAHMIKNDICIFPSMLPHRVNPVTRGKRRALVGWVRGPAWV